ncbi:DoxX family protein [Salinisphaera sp. USBA-960]|uniref:DoxX family protein n=1 Tax=Salinisphaera orenii TaxID=856731 RepID=UPI000DBE8548|nr:DoxX family protein [Salifodinibacter halophilus]NNC27211.1 DoxX family protein [Salifodinibacter halophilus]
MPNRNVTLLVARCLIALLFVLFGWQKLNDFNSAVAVMAHHGLPLPMVAAIIAIAMEFVVGIAIAVGALTRPLALALAAYTLATAVLGHPYWTMTGGAAFEAEINFYKNISIIGGLLALYAVGPGRLAVDAALGRS